jgi:hypothetical protein
VAGSPGFWPGDSSKKTRTMQLNLLRGVETAGAGGPPLAERPPPWAAGPAAPRCERSPLARACPTSSTSPRTRCCCRSRPRPPGRGHPAETEYSHHPLGSARSHPPAGSARSHPPAGSGYSHRCPRGRPPAAGTGLQSRSWTWCPPAPDGGAAANRTV